MAAPGKEGGLSEEEWEMLCNVLRAEPTKGLRWTELVVVCTKAGGSSGTQCGAARARFATAIPI